METDGLDVGTVWIFPKIDGTNGSVWLENPVERGGDFIHCGSRNREVTPEDDNAGFAKAMKSDGNIICALHKYPEWRIYGEWLVPHTLKTYREEAWKEFYIFDVHNGERWLTYEEYAQPLIDQYLNVIPPLAVIENPSDEQLMGLLDTNTYLIKDGCGAGEGLVLKNYAHVNKFGRQTWAKIVRTAFKDKHRSDSPVKVSQGKNIYEIQIVNDFVTMALVDKVYANIFNEQGGWSAKFIPRLLQTVFYDLVREHAWDMCKNYKYPTINFGKLRKYANAKTKELKSELF
jgi:hypothetical protein